MVDTALFSQLDDIEAIDNVCSNIKVTHRRSGFLL